jgi:hypothetical protein
MFNRSFRNNNNATAIIHIILFIFFVTTTFPDISTLPAAYS